MKEQPSCKDLTPTTGLRFLQKTKRRQTGPTLGELYNWKGLALYHGSNYDEAIKVFTDGFGVASSSGKDDCKAVVVVVVFTTHHHA